MKNPIFPYELTHEGIKAYQEQEPYPNLQEVYETYFPISVEKDRKFVIEYTREEIKYCDTNYLKYVEEKPECTHIWCP